MELLGRIHQDREYSPHSINSSALCLALIGIFALRITYYRFITSNSTLGTLPELNHREWFDIANVRRTRKFMQQSLEVLTTGRAQFQDKPYRLYSDWGEQIVLSPKDVDGIKGDKRLEFTEPAVNDFHGYFPEFQGFNANRQLPSVIKKHLTKPLGKLVAPLSEEASLAMQAVLTNSSQWQDFRLHAGIMPIVSRMSTRIFMGVTLCRDDGWNKASMSYIQKAFRASDLLRNYPRFMKPLARWFMPSCWSLSRALADARKYLKPYVDSRHQIRRGLACREDEVVFDDAIEWFEREYGKHDPATEQIGLSMVAVHTTTDLLHQTVLNIAQHPDLFDSLRREIISVISQQGLTKAALHNLKLLDSVIKESQRLKPIFLGGFRRMAMEDMTLPNGMFLKKGARILIDSTHMWNSEYYEEASKFDGYRFLHMREGQDTQKQTEPPSSVPISKRDSKSAHAHLVSTSAYHFGFGHGLHACPGRFFAANLMKIAMCHLLLKYDWKLPEVLDKDGRGEIQGNKAALYKPIAYGMSYLPNPATKLLIRRREEEIDLARMDVGAR